MGVDTVSACASSPEWMALIIARVYFSLILLPTPYLNQPHMSARPAPLCFKYIQKQQVVQLEFACRPDNAAEYIRQQALLEEDTSVVGPKNRCLHTRESAWGLPAASPSGVDQPSSGTVLLHLLSQHARILHGMPHQECAPKAGAEGGLRLSDSLLCACNLCSQTQPCSKGVV